MAFQTTLPIDQEVAARLTWFDDSPDTGDPACLCSLCGTTIPERDSVILRLYRTPDGNPKATQEARLHQACTPTLLPGWHPQYADEEGW